MRLRSTDTFSGMHKVTGKPCEAPIMAYAMPVLPLVESSRILADVNLPLAWACSTMLAAARSLIEPPGFGHSALPRISTLVNSAAIRTRRSKGVLPMRSPVRWPRTGRPKASFSLLRAAAAATAPMFGDEPGIMFKLLDDDLRNVSQRRNQTPVTGN